MVATISKKGPQNCVQINWLLSVFSDIAETGRADGEGADPEDSGFYGRGRMDKREGKKW